jgi:uncharacterized membrane protein
MLTIIFVFIGIVVVGLYALWRYKKAVEAPERFAHLVPPKNRLGWNIRNTAELEKGTVLGLPPSDSDGALRGASDVSVRVSPTEYTDLGAVDFAKDPLTLAAAADGIVAGSFIADAALHIDPQVLHALEFSTAEHLHGLADIDSYVEAHFFDAPIASAEGWFERLTGYVAEQKAATALEQLGHHVEFAPVANQPVWDLLVDGHPVQIKEGLAGAKDFIAHHPGVDVFTGHDVAAAIKDPSVHALDVLDKDSIHAATEQSLNGVDGVVDPSFHLPFITMAFSSWREAKLLWNEKTTYGRALKNVSMDVAGVGGGALVGAKTGGLLGSVFGPPGTVVGSIVGTIVGAIGGKFASTAIRRAPFKEARESYNLAVSNAQDAVELEISRSKQRITELQSEYQQRFIENRTKVEESARLRVGEIRIKFENDLLGFCERFPIFLRDLKFQLEREGQEVLSRLPSRSILAWVLASEDALYRTVVKAWFKQARKLVDLELKTFAEITPRTVDTLHAEIQRFLKEYEFELGSLATELRAVRDQYMLAQEHAEEVRRDAVAEVKRVRNDLIQKLGQQVMAFHERIVFEIQSWNRTIGDKKLVLKREAAAVGIEF